MEAIENARKPGPRTCGKCKQELYAPLDKLSMELYGVCAHDTKPHQQPQLFNLSKLL